MAEQRYTAGKLAGKPGMPATRSGVIRLAKREGWDYQQRPGRGGGREYALSSLPVTTQIALLKEEAPAPEEQPPLPEKAKASKTVDRESLWEAYERRTDKQKAIAEYRLRAVQAVETLAANGVNYTTATEEVAAQYGESRATLYRWRRRVRGLDPCDWLAALVPRQVGKRQKGDWSPEAWDHFKALYLRPEQPAVATCYDLLKEAAQEHGWKIPAKRTIERWVNEIPITQRVLLREGENALRRLLPAQERTVADLRALEWVNGDGYQHNVFVRFPDGTVARPKTWFWQDVHSRKLLAWRTDRTEHSDMIRLALGDVLENYGIPEHVTIDNTRAAANKWLTGGVANRYRFKVREEDPVGLLKNLGIEVHWTSVFKGKGHGQAKPVERAFGVGGLGEYVDKHPKFAGAYTGPSVEAKPDNYQEAAVEWDTFIATLAGAIEHWNTKTGRNTEMAAGQLSYAEVFRRSYERNAHQVRRPTESQRRMWLLMAESVSVQRDGTVRLAVGSGPHGKNRYGCDALLEYIGQKVVIRFDPEQLHESVHCYQLNGQYIGPAECIQAAGFGDAAAGREWNRQRRKQISAIKEAAQAEARMSTVEAVEYLPEPEPDPEGESEPQTNVVRGAWPQKAVAGSDVPAQAAEEDDIEQHRQRFDDVVLAAGKRWRDEQL